MREPHNVSLLSRILGATDLSPRAVKAVARAVQLADEHRATLTILHVLPDALGDEASKRQIVLQVEQYLHRKVIKLSPDREKTVSIEVTTGTAFVEIIRRAREKAVDIILVGAHGEQFINKLLFGTTVERIVRRGDRPVLVVKRRVRGPYRTVLMATDFSDQSGEALALAMRVAPSAKYVLLHAYQGIEQQLWRSDFRKSDILRYRRELANQSREKLKHFIRKRGLDNTSFVRLVRYGRAPQVISSAARRLRPDLVAVGSAGRTGLPHVLLGSVAEHVLREVSCDVLVARPAR
jgi:Universal stress protein UspA and related nucleotide-binding proteins